MTLETIHGQSSWKVASANVEAYVTQLGGMVGPIKFYLDGRTIEPFAVAPWCEEDVDTLPILKALRGDFFCLPFGDSGTPFFGEDHPLHGEPANDQWQFDNLKNNTLDIVYELRLRPAKLYKTIRCGDQVLYQRNMVLGMKGPMSFGTHAMIEFRSPGHLSFSPSIIHQVFPGQFENPAVGGYSSLDQAGEFSSLKRAPLATGGHTDLTSFPARPGYDDLIQFASDPIESLAWAAVTFPEEGYLYYQLKNPRILTSTILWFSNGGRHYAPWSGRHRNVVGIEEVTSYFHLGLRGSVSPNPYQNQGIATFRDCNPNEPIDVRTICGVCALPFDFGPVAKIVSIGEGIVIVGESGQRIEQQLDLMFIGVQ